MDETGAITGLLQAREAHDYYKEAGAANLVESRIPTVFGGVSKKTEEHRTACGRSIGTLIPLPHFDSTFPVVEQSYHRKSKVEWLLHLIPTSCRYSIKSRRI